MPAAVEGRLIPRKRRSTTRILPEHQHLEPGDRVPDYGPGDPEFEVVRVEPPHLLVYRSDRGRTSFTWLLKLDAALDDSTRLHIRLRITTANRRRTAPLRKLGDLFDLATIALLFKGLEERVRPRG